MKKREFWKVCKKLANEERLDVLRKVMTLPGEGGLPVGQIADEVHAGQPATSIYLAELQDVCGLVASCRAGRYNLYYPAPDASDAKAVTLFKSLRKYFFAERVAWASVNGTRPPAPKFLSILPALANATRVHLLGLIRIKGRTDLAQIGQWTRLTELNLRRHLSYIVTCGLANVCGDDVIWREPSDETSRILIDLSLA